MRTRLALSALALSALLLTLLATPASAGGKLEGTIALPAAELSQMSGGGYSNAGGCCEELRQSCPAGGPLDGVVYKFFDLKGSFKKFKAYGPKPAFGQNTPVGNMNDYDLDLFVLDAKCNLLPASGTKNGGGAFETASPNKPARYAVIAYYAGPYPNIAVTLEYS